MKYKVFGSTQAQWNIEGSFVAGETIVEMDSKKAAKYKDVLIPLEAPEITEDVEEEKSDKFSKEELEDIVENKGRKALRQIAKAFGIKFRSTKVGIKKILEAQK